MVIATAILLEEGNQLVDALSMRVERNAAELHGHTTARPDSTLDHLLTALDPEVTQMAPRAVPGLHELHSARFSPVSTPRLGIVNEGPANVNVEDLQPLTLSTIKEPSRSAFHPKPGGKFRTLDYES